MNQNSNVSAILTRIQNLAAVAGGAALLLMLVGAFLDTQQFYRSYLIGYLYWLGPTLGCLGLLMLHYLVGGGWSFIIRRQLEAAAKVLPVMALLFIPVLLGMSYLFPWTHVDELAAHPIIEHKSPYLNIPFFIVRAIGYFAIWGTLVFFLSRWSTRQDDTGNPGILEKLKWISGPGIVVLALTTNFASVDWIMSLEPEWFSTIYGLLFLVSGGLSALAIIVLTTRRLSNEKPLVGLLAPKYFHNYGNLILAFVMLWAYMSFSQFLIIWSANLPEEVSWYVHRTGHGWQVLAIALVIFHFALPFLILLNRQSKRVASNLAKIAVWIVVVRFFDLFWWTKPAFSPEGFAIHWMDLVAPVAIGGIWVAVFAWQLKAHPLMPLHDPRLEEAFGAEVLNHG